MTPFFKKKILAKVKPTDNDLAKWNKVIETQASKKAESKLPHIDKLFEAFQKHQSKMQRAITNHRWEEIKKIEQEFKDEMKILGIYDRFDWTEDDDKKIWNEKIAKL